MKKEIVLLTLSLTMLALTFNIELSHSQTDYWLFIYNYDQYYCGYTYPSQFTYHYYPNGTEVEITAYPNEGYKFRYWIVSPYGSVSEMSGVEYSNPLTLTMDQNYIVFPYWAWDVSIGAFNFYDMAPMNIYFKLLGEYYPDPTPVTFYNLTETINITVSEYGFLGWLPTEETNTTITITHGGDYVAFYYYDRESPLHENPSIYPKGRRFRKAPKQ